MFVFALEKKVLFFPQQVMDFSKKICKSEEQFTEWLHNAKLK